MAKGRGFTIVEVMLFLAVSTMLLGVALTYTSQTLKNARYADTTKSFETYIEQQYTQVQAGTATRNATSVDGSCTTTGVSIGASDSCIVLGHVLAFDTSGPGADSTIVKKYTVVADATPSILVNNDFEAFAYSNVRVQESADAPIDTHELDWGTELSELRYKDNVTGFNRLAILRSPISESIYIFTFSQGPQIDHARTFQDGIISANANQPAVICFTSQDFGTSLVASVTLNGSAGIDSIGSTIKGQTDVRVGGLTC